MNDENGKSMEPTEGMPFIRLGESNWKIIAWLTELSRKLITEMRGGILEGTICYS